MNTHLFLFVTGASSLFILFAAFIFVKLHHLVRKPNDDHRELPDAITIRHFKQVERDHTKAG